MKKRIFLHIVDQRQAVAPETVNNGLQQALRQLGFEFVDKISQAQIVITDSVDAIAPLLNDEITVIQYDWTPAVAGKQAKAVVRIFRFQASSRHNGFEDMAEFLAGLQ